LASCTSPVCIRWPCHGTPSPDLLSNRSSTARWASITIITVQLLMDAGLLQVHMFTVNVVAPHTNIYTKKWRQISSASLPERHVRVPKQFFLSISVTISILASWFVGAFDCWRVSLSAIWLSANWIVGELDCRRVGLSVSCPVTVLAKTSCARMDPTRKTFRFAYRSLINPPRPFVKYVINITLC